MGEVIRSVKFATLDQFWDYFHALLNYHSTNMFETLQPLRLKQDKSICMNCPAIKNTVAMDMKH